MQLFGKLMLLLLRIILFQTNQVPQKSQKAIGCTLHTPFVTSVTPSLEVMRKSSYKGSVSIERSLPLDSTTVFGLLAIIGCVCKAPTLGQDALQCVKGVLASLEEHMCFHESLHLVPNKPKYNVEIAHNKVKLSQMKAVFQKLGLPFSRFVSGQSAFD